MKKQKWSFSFEMFSTECCFIVNDVKQDKCDDPDNKSGLCKFDECKMSGKKLIDEQPA